MISLDVPDDLMVEGELLPSLHGGDITGRGAISGNLNMASAGLELVPIGSVGQGTYCGLVASSRLGEGIAPSSSVDDACMASVGVIERCSALVRNGPIVVNACRDSNVSNVRNYILSGEQHVVVDACMDRPHARECSTDYGGILGSGSTVHGYCAQNACVNAKAKLQQQNSAFNSPDGPGMSDFSKGNAWRMPKAFPMPSLESLGRISDDEGNIILDEDEINLTVEKFSNAVVGRMFGRKIPYHQLSIELKRRWEAFGVFRLITLSGDCFLCIFNSAESCEAVLMGGPWVLFGQVIGVDRWTSSFSPSSLEGFKTPVWVRMPGLPLYCWSSKNIARMCASIGEPLWLDSATEQIERGLFARACIRLDLSKPLKPGFWVAGRHGRFFQPLEYEGLSLFCFRCRQVGHKEISCKVPAPVKISETCPQPSPVGHADLRHANHDLNVRGGQVIEGDVQVDASPLNVPEGVESQETGKQLEDRGAGPWMLVSRRHRSNNGVGTGNLRDHSKFTAGTWAKNVKQGSKSKEVIGHAAGGKLNSISTQSQLPFTFPSRNGRSSSFQSGVWQSGHVQHAKAMQAAPIMGGKQWNSSTGLCWNDKNQVLEERHVQNQEDIGEQNVMEGQGAFMKFSAMPMGQKDLAVGVLGQSPRTIKAQLARASRSFKERMVSELGPVSNGSRKRRKAHLLNDGGDASPSMPP